MVCPMCGRSGASLWIVTADPTRILWGCQCGQAWGADTGRLVEDVLGPRP